MLNVGRVVPPLPVLSLLFDVVGSNSVAVALAVLSNAPTLSIVALTVMFVLALAARLVMVHGNAEQPPPVTFVIVRLEGVSVTWIFVAVEGPAFATFKV